LVVWSDDRHDDGDIFARWLNALTFEPRAPEFQLVEIPGRASEPALDSQTLSPRHLIRVYYTDDRNGNLDIYATTFSSSYLTQPKDPTANQEPVITGPEDAHSPAVQTPLDAWGLLLWAVDNPESSSEIRMQRYYASSLPRGEPSVVVDGPGVHDQPSVVNWSTADSDPFFLVAWQDDSFGTFDVLGTSVAPNGRVSRRIQLLAGD
jgi:hypothetical protein